MIREEFVSINGHSINFNHYKTLGYDIKVGKLLKVKTEHLMRGSSVIITSICDISYDECKNAYKDYYNYTNGLTELYYCKKCHPIKSEKLFMERYGVSNPMYLEETIIKMKKTFFDKYGEEWYSKTTEYKQKYKKTSTERYGVDNPSKNDKIKQKILNINGDWMISTEFRNKSKLTKEKTHLRNIRLY